MIMFLHLMTAGNMMQGKDYRTDGVQYLYMDKVENVKDFLLSCNRTFDGTYVLLITTDGVPMSACWSEDGLTTLCGRDYTADDHFLFKEINIDGARVVSFNSLAL